MLLFPAPVWKSIPAPPAQRDEPQKYPQDIVTDFPKIATQGGGGAG